MIVKDVVRDGGGVRGLVVVRGGGVVWGQTGVNTGRVKE